MPEATKHEYLGVPAIIASPAMHKVIDLVRKVAPTSASVLITGETGTGKEIVARAVHSYSMRSSRPWVDINCGALPEHLIESELFGHERGAFSGADTARPGLFELAHTGTIFLDEIGELDPRMQIKLLRVLDRVGYYRLGGRKKVVVDTRVVAATNQDLEGAVAAHRFRSDLYHRLNEYQIRIPPLRQRPEDVIALAEHFLSSHSLRASLSPDAKAALLRHRWPGNIRELRNLITTAAINATSFEISPSDFNFIAAPPQQEPATVSGLDLDTLEREAILNAMRSTGGQVQKSAELLGISRRTLSRKLNLYRPNAHETATCAR